MKVHIGRFDPVTISEIKCFKYSYQQAVFILFIRFSMYIFRPEQFDISDDNITIIIFGVLWQIALINKTLDNLSRGKSFIKLYLNDVFQIIYVSMLSDFRIQLVSLSSMYCK